MGSSQSSSAPSSSTLPPTVAAAGPLAAGGPALPTITPPSARGQFPINISPDVKIHPETQSETILAEVPVDSGPGTYEDLHRKCKDVFPVPFEGAKLVINKGLSNHFQISHTMTMSSLTPSGYRFGCTYVGSKQFSPTEAYPVLMGECDASGNLNANLIHHLTKSLRCKFVAQVQNQKWVATQLSTDLKGSSYVASLTCANVDIVNESGVIASQYLQNVSKRLALGAELVYQYGPTVPGCQLAIYSLAGRYTTDNWQLSSTLTPLAGALHVCYYHRANDALQIGVELEGSLRTQECTTTLGYQLDLPKANLTFRGQLDSNWCVAAVMEKKLPPLPFTFALSAFANHVKGAYRFGVGLIVG